MYYKMRFAGHFIPLMISSYVGTLKSLLYSGLFRIFTPDAISTRVPMILAGVVTIWLFFLLLRRISGPWSAAAGAVLLATDTMFLLTTTFDWGPVALQHLLLTGALLLLHRYYEMRRLLYLWWGFFSLGLAMWDKAVFIWSLTGLCAAALVVFPRTILGLARPRSIAVAVLAFFAGAYPLVRFNIHSKGETFRSNAAWSWETVASKLPMAKGTLQGAYLFGYMVREDVQGGTPLSPGGILGRTSDRVSAWFGYPRENLMMSGIAAALLLVPLLWRAGARALRTMLFATLFLVVAWLAMAVNPATGGSVHHVVLLWPFPQLLVAVAFGEAAQKFGRPGKAAMITALVLLAGSNLLVTNEYYRMLRRNGGSLVWTDAVFGLSQALAGIPATQVMPIDWGMFDSLRLLNAGKLPLRVGMDPLSKQELDEHDRQTVREWLATPGTVFVSHTGPNEVYAGVNGRLDRVALEAGFRRDEIRSLSDNNGRPIFAIFRYIPAVN